MTLIDNNNRICSLSPFILNYYMQMKYKQIVVKDNFFKIHKLKKIKIFFYKNHLFSKLCQVR